MKRINIRESLLNMDRETDCKYDLTSLYESVKLDDEKKKQLCQYIDKVDIDATNRFLSNEASSQGLMENACDDIADDELKEWVDDEWYGDEENTYEYIASKSVPDSDGFYTDYTWYRNVDTGENVFVFGDTDIYKPEDGDFDHECESQEEAQEWFDSYNGFDEMDESFVEIESDPTFVDRYTHTLIGDTNAALEADSKFDSWTWDHDDNEISLTTIKGKDSRTHKIPRNHLTRNFDTINQDVDFIKNKVYESLNEGKDELVEFSYRVYSLDEEGNELDCEDEFDNEEDAIKFAQSLKAAHVVFVPVPDSDEGPEYAEYIEINAPYHDYEIIWASNESLNEAWTDAYEHFNAIVDKHFPDENKIESEVENLYSQHKGEPDWDEAYRRWHEDVDTGWLEEDIDEDEVTTVTFIFDPKEWVGGNQNLDDNFGYHEDDLRAVPLQFTPGSDEPVTVELTGSLRYINDFKSKYSNLFESVTEEEDLTDWFNDSHYDIIDAGWTEDGEIIVSLNHKVHGLENVANHLSSFIEDNNYHVIDWNVNGNNVFVFEVIHNDDYNNLTNDTDYFRPTNESLSKQTLDEGWFSDDDFEDDMMHTDIYGGDPMYCRRCGGKLDYSDGYGFCPDCDGVPEGLYDEDLNEDLESDLYKKYIVKDVHTNPSIKDRIERLIKSEFVDDIQPVTMYDQQLIKLIASNGKVFYLVPTTLSQVDVYDESENLIDQYVFWSHLVDEILNDTEAGFVYQVVGGDFAGTYTREEVEALPCFSGRYTDDPKRPKLDNQPILAGYLSPMVDGWAEGHKARIRYETEEVYNMMSEAIDKHLSDKTGTLGNLIASNNDLLKTFSTKEEIINFLIDIEPQCTDKKYLNQIKMKVIHARNFFDAYKLLYNAMLKGDGLGSIEKEIRGTKKFAYEALEEDNSNKVFTMINYTSGDMESGINGDSFDPVCSFYANSLEEAKQEVIKFNEHFNVDYFCQEGHLEECEIYPSLADYIKDIYEGDNTSLLEESTKTIKCPVNGLYDGKEDNCFYFKDGQCTLPRDGGNPGEECKEYRDWERLQNKSDRERKLRMHFLSTNQFEESLNEDTMTVNDIVSEQPDMQNYVVYDESGNPVGDPQVDWFDWIEDAIDFATENNYPTIKIHRYTRDFSDADWFVGDEESGHIYHGEQAAINAWEDLSETNVDAIMEPVEGEEGKLIPDGDPVVVWENGKEVEYQYKESLQEAKTGVPYKGYTLCYGCHGTDRWYVKDSYDKFLGVPSGFSNETEAQEYVDSLDESLTESSDENWAVFATDIETGNEYCAGVYESEDYAHYWAAQDKIADSEFQYGNFKYRVEQVPEYTAELDTSRKELNSLKISNHQASQEELRTAFDECFTSEQVTEAVAPDGYEPKKKGTAYKVFKVKNGKLYPPMVANPGGADTPVGVWLTADEGEFAGLSKTGRPQVKSTGSGTLSYRPGWHLGDIPRASQFDRTNKETGEKEFPKDFVWAECEYAMDIDYQPESDEQGYMRMGKDGKPYRSDKYQHSLAGLPKLPKDGYYKYRTNPRPDTVPWVITGAIKVNRLLSDAEVNDILASKGIDPIHRQGGDKTLAELGL